MSGKDNVDAIPGKPKRRGGGGDNIARLAGLQLGGDDAESRYQYRMDHRKRGKMIIINNKTFQARSERSGTDIDAANLYTDFRQLGFDVHTVHNQTAHQMLQLMIKASQEDHTNRDCFAVAVLTHGDDDGVLYGVDDTISIDNFISPIKTCASLAGKPKIFIFQACRGNELDDGLEAAEESDAIGEPPPAQRIPLEADFLYAYSTTPGYFAWRHSQKGSWFVQALHKMLGQYGGKLDFVKLLTRVNYEVAYEYESNSSQPQMNRKKQIPSIVSMLTKDLYLTPK